MLLFRQAVAETTLDPPDRSRYWYHQLWRNAPKRRYTPADAARIVARNWHIPSKELRTKARY